MFEFDGYDFYGINKTEELVSSLIQYKASCDMMRAVPRYNSYVSSTINLMLATMTLFKINNKIYCYKSSIFLKLEDIVYNIINDNTVEFDYNEEQIFYLTIKYNLKINDVLMTDINYSVTRICDRIKND